MSLRLSQEDFLQSFEKVPRVALNLLIEDKDGQLLLTKRSIPPQIGVWHYPGSFLLKNETIHECLQRIALSELGYTLTEDPKLVGVFENLNKDPRGHVLDIMYKITLPEQIVMRASDETTEAEYFKTLPKNIGFNHRETLYALGYSS